MTYRADPRVDAYISESSRAHPAPSASLTSSTWADRRRQLPGRRSVTFPRSPRRSERPRRSGSAGRA